MSQQINLYNPTLASERELLSGRSVLLGLVAMLLLAVLASVWSGVHTRGLLERERDQAAQVAHLQNELARLGQELAQRKSSATLDHERVRLEASLTGRKQVVATLESGELGNTSGVSEYFRAFARQATDGLWLTSFRIDRGGSDILIAGRAFKAELVPDYIVRLKQESVLRGHGFAQLDVRQPSDGDAAQPRSGTEAYLEFRLATQREAAAEQAAGTGSARR